MFKIWLIWLILDWIFGMLVIKSKFVNTVCSKICAFKKLGFLIGISTWFLQLWTVTADHNKKKWKKVYNFEAHLLVKINIWHDHKFNLKLVWLYLRVFKKSKKPHSTSYRGHPWTSFDSRTFVTWHQTMPDGRTWRL